MSGPSEPGRTHMQTWGSYCKTFTSPGPTCRPQRPLQSHMIYHSLPLIVIPHPFRPLPHIFQLHLLWQRLPAAERRQDRKKKKKKKTGGKSTNVSLPPTTSQPSSSTRGREEDGTKQKDHATKSSIPMTVVFFATKQQCMDARDALRSIWLDSPNQVDTFHGSTSPEQRLNLLDKFKKGLIRVLCCTKAFGLGCDIPDIEYSIIYNYVDSMVDLWQKGGRAARGR